MGNLYDVAIIGAGPSGIAAAIYAAKNGVKTVLIEKDSIVGGSAIKAQSYTLRAAANDTMDNLLSGITKRAWNRTIFHPEELIDRYYYQLKRYSVDVLCEHYVISVETSDNDITSILCISPDGKKMVSAKVFIDASAVCAMEKLTGNRKEQGHRRCYVTALIGKVETIGGRCYSEEAQNLLQDSINHAKYTKRMDKDIEISVSPTVRGDIALLEVGANVREGDMGSVMRGHLNFALKFLQEFGFGYENVSIISSSKNMFYPVCGASKPKYSLTYDDVMSQKSFDDSIMSLFYNKESKNETIEKQFTIPYGSQLSTAFNNLLYCGRTIGINSNAKSLVDGIPIHFETGKAAGIAASIAIKKEVSLKEVSIEELRTEIGYSEGAQNIARQEIEVEPETEYIEPDMKKIQQVGEDRLCNFMPIEEPEQIVEEPQEIVEEKPIVDNKYLTFFELDRALGLLDGTFVEQDEPDFIKEDEQGLEEEAIKVVQIDSDELEGVESTSEDNIDNQNEKASIPDPLYDSIFSCYDKFEEEEDNNLKSLEQDKHVDKQPKHLKEVMEISKLLGEEYNEDHEQTIRPETNSTQKTDDAMDRLKASANSTIYDDIFGLDLNYGE